MGLVHLPIIQQREIVQGVFEVSLGLTGVDFSFQAGQYIRIHIAHLLYPDEKGDFRDFSICSSPRDRDRITVTFRNTHSGFKKTLLEMPLGSLVSVRGPYGLLGLPEDMPKNIVFVAGGIGITPFLSMIRFVCEGDYSNTMTLIYTNTIDADAPYIHELDELQKNNVHFTMKQRTDFLDERFLQEEMMYAKNALWYVSGPPGMVMMTFDVLRQFGVSSEKIIFEEMTGYEEYDSLEHRTFSTPKTLTAPDVAKSTSLDEHTKNTPPLFLDVKKLTSIIETSFEGVVITDPEGIIRYVNPAWQKLTGWKSEEVVDKVTPRILKSGQTPAEKYDELWKTIKQGEMVHLEIINKKKNGDIYYAEDTILPLKNDQGEVTEFVGFQRDVTERQHHLKQFIDRSEVLTERNEFLENTKKAMLNLLEDAQDLEKKLEFEKTTLKKEKEKSEAILQFLKSIGDGVFAVDSELNIIFMNKTAEDLSGYSFEEAKSKHYTDIFHFVLEKNQSAPYTHFIEHVIQTGVISTLPNHTSIIKRDGSVIPVSDSAAPIRDVSGVIVGCIVVFQDDTKKRELDQLKEGFISVAAHQLRTPLGGMRWSMELLLSDDEANKLPEEVRTELEQMYENSQRMITLVNDLLNTSRIDNEVSKEKCESSDAVQLLQKVVESAFDEAKNRSVTIDFSVKKEGLKPVLIISKNVYEAFQNLIVNAVKYSNTGGTVTIGADQIGAYLRVTIADTGIGIPKDQQSKLFAKFFRASNAVLKETDGSGLGLSVAKFFIEESGGKIWFESEEGKGTTFFVDLPLAA